MSNYRIWLSTVRFLLSPCGKIVDFISTGILSWTSNRCAYLKANRKSRIAVVKRETEYSERASALAGVSDERKRIRVCERIIGSGSWRGYKIHIESERRSTGPSALPRSWKRQLSDTDPDCGRAWGICFSGAVVPQGSGDLSTVVRGEPYSERPGAPRPGRGRPPESKRSRRCRGTMKL